MRVEGQLHRPVDAEPHEIGSLLIRLGFRPGSKRPSELEVQLVDREAHPEAEGVLGDPLPDDRLPAIQRIEELPQRLLFQALTHLSNQSLACSAAPVQSATANLRRA